MPDVARVQSRIGNIQHPIIVHHHGCHVPVPINAISVALPLSGRPSRSLGGILRAFLHFLPGRSCGIFSRVASLLSGLSVSLAAFFASFF